MAQGANCLRCHRLLPTSAVAFQTFRLVFDSHAPVFNTLSVLIPEHIAPSPVPSGSSRRCASMSPFRNLCSFVGPLPYSQQAPLARISRICSFQPRRRLPTSVPKRSRHSRLITSEADKYGAGADGAPLVDAEGEPLLHVVFVAPQIRSLFAVLSSRKSADSYVRPH